MEKKKKNKHYYNKVIERPRENGTWANNGSLMSKINTFSAPKDSSGTEYTETGPNEGEAFYFIE